jgi:hypothetical protein
VGRRGDAGHATPASPWLAPTVPQDMSERAVQQAALALGEVGANQGEAGSEHRVQVHPASRLACLSAGGAGLAAGG